MTVVNESGTFEEGAKTATSIVEFDVLQAAATIVWPSRESATRELKPATCVGKE